MVCFERHDRILQVYSVQSSLCAITAYSSIAGIIDTGSDTGCLTAGKYTMNFPLKTCNLYIFIAAQ